jgi:hypothetical protein
MTHGSRLLITFSITGIVTCCFAVIAAALAMRKVGASSPTFRGLFSDVGKKVYRLLHTFGRARWVTSITRFDAGQAGGAQ